MNIEDIKKILVDQLFVESVYVNKNDDGHYFITVIGDYFLNMNMVQRQQVIYIPLMQYILDGRIHSLSIRVFTLMEWEREYKLNDNINF